MDKKIGIVFALAMVISAFIMGAFFYNARKPINIIRVVGYASGEYDSDILKWRLSLSANAPANNQIQGIQILARQISEFRSFMINKGFDAAELEIAPSYNWANYNRDGNITHYIFEQRIAFTIRDLSRFDEVAHLAIDLTELSETGIQISNSSLEYYLSELPDLKIEIIAEATRDARARAQEVAKTTNTKLGKLRNGRVGVFQITEPLSVEIQSMGIFSTHTRRKQISVTMTGEFELK